MNSVGERVPFVGRISELACLKELLASRKGALLIRGEPGIGKTRLLSELTMQARAEGFTVAVGRCYDAEPPISLLPLLSVLQSLGADSEGVPALLSSPASGAGGIETGVDPRLRLFYAVGTLIKDIAKTQPVLLVVEDIQWSDPDTRLLLNYLVDQHESDFLLLLSARESGMGAPLMSGLASKCASLRLGPLSLDDAREFIWKACGPLGEDEVSFMFELSGGNALFLEELTEHLSLSGLLEEHSAMTVLDSKRLPPTLAEAIEYRLGLLPQGVRDIVVAASCAGPSFRRDVIEQGLGFDAAACQDALHEGLRWDFLRLGVEDYLEFSHALVQEVLYRQLEPALSRSYHRRLGLLSLERPTLFSIEQAATHQAKGFVDAERHLALPGCRLAAQKSEDSLAFGTAANFWRLALTCLDATPSLQRAEVLVSLAEALRASGDANEAIGYFKTAIEVYDSCGYGARAGEVCYRVGEILRAAMKIEEAVDWLQRALENVESEAVRARCLATLGSCYVSLHRVEEGIELLRAAWRETQAQPDFSPTIAVWTVQALSGIQEVEEAREVAEQGLAQARVLGDSSGAMRLAGMLVFSSLHRLRLTEALEYVGLMEEMPAMQDAPAIARMMICRCLVEAYQGNWQAVRNLSLEWASQVRRAGRFHKASADLMFAEASSCLNEHSTAASVLKRALPDLAEMVPMAQLHGARFALRCGEVNEAAALLGHAAARTMEDPSVGRHLFLGDVVGSLREEALAARIYDELNLENRQMVIIYTPVSVQRVMGKLACVLGDWNLAFDHFEHAVRTLEEGQASFEYAQTLLDYALARERRHRRGDYLKADSLRNEAANVLMRLELPCERQADAPSGPAVAVSRFALSDREVEILRLISEGTRNPKIAENLGISRHTVDRHLENIFNKMQVHSRTQAVVAATAAGLLV